MAVLNKLPQTSWLQTREIYSFIALEASNPRSGFRQGLAPSEDSRGGIVLLPSYCRSWSFLVSLAHSCINPSKLCLLLSCVSMSSPLLKSTLVFGFRANFNTVWPYAMFWGSGWAWILETFFSQQQRRARWSWGSYAGTLPRGLILQGSGLTGGWKTWSWKEWASSVWDSGIGEGSWAQDSSHVPKELWDCVRWPCRRSSQAYIAPFFLQLGETSELPTDRP